jgi:DNA-directed RNA polymerase specialized sigma subunit
MALSRPEELDLVSRTRTGDPAATWRLLDEHAARIRWCANRFRCRGLGLEDQYQTGVVAFLEALRQFMPERGTRLWTFAQHNVRGSMIQACADQQGLSDDARRWYRRVVTANDVLWQERHSQPTPQEVADRSGAPEATVRELFAHWEGRAVPLLDEAEETEEDRDGVVLASPEPSLDEPPSQLEETGAKQRRIADSLGPSDSSKLLVLAILREKVVERKPVWYEWPEIAVLLAGSHQGPDPPWRRVLALEFPHLAGIPSGWADVCALFQVPPPVLTGDALKQWYCRTRRTLQAPGGPQ